MSSEFVIKKRPKESEAIIYLGKDKIAKIEKHEGFTFKLITYKDKQEWVLSNLVHGQRRPFSYAVLKTAQKTPDDGEREIQTGQEVFVVREQLFKHNGKFYMWILYSRLIITTINVHIPSHTISPDSILR